MLENNLRWKTKLWETMRGNIGISIRATAVGPSERAGAHSESSQDYHRCLELHPMAMLSLSFFGLGQISLLLFIQLVAIVVVI